ncbi:MAG: C4-type zinc ribbon domain-containing protein [Acidobacteriota bacterium]
MRVDLERLIQLQEVEANMKECSERIEFLPRQLAELEAKLSKTLDQQKALQERIARLGSGKKDLEMSIQDLEQKNSKYRGQLFEVKTNEQYRALQHEIQYNNEQIRKIEDDILLKMEEEEQLRQEVREIDRQLQREQTVIDTEKKAAEVAVERDKHTLNELSNKRQSLIEAIAPDLYENYVRIASFRKGVALARIQDGSCQVCHVRVRPQVMSLVMAGDTILTCDSCSRILYWTSPAPYEVAE